MEIETPVEFSFKECLHFLKRSPKELLHRVEDEAVYKLIKQTKEKVLFKVSAAGGEHLKVDFPVIQPVDEDKDKIKQYIIDWFDLDKDLKPFYELAASDPFLSKPAEKHFGYRIVGQPDLYESLIWAVLGQQINLSFAYSLKAQFVKKFGKKLSFNGKEYYLFPEPGVVAQLRVDDLLKIRFSKQKSSYAIGISESFVNGDISKEKLKGLPVSKAAEKLMEIKGIGNWTAHYALMKTFRCPDAFPLEDAGLANALKTLLKLDRKPTSEEIKEVFHKYKGWEAYATLYLWQSL